MRVGIDAHALGSHSSGNETYFENLLQHLEKVLEIRLVAR
jgi:hypothetical protein